MQVCFTKRRIFRLAAKSVFAKALPSFVLLIMLSCVETFEPVHDEQITGILVVDGFLDPTAGIATVTLSQTRPLTDHAPAPPIVDAEVRIENSAGNEYHLHHQDSGTYFADISNTEANTTYTLHITTAAGSQFVSDAIRLLNTPAIDSITFALAASGEALKIMVSTHDSTNDVQYYSWSYEETYEYHSPFVSTLTWENNVVGERDPNERIDICWRNERSTTINIGSTTANIDNLISQHLLTSIPKGSIKTSVRYSILVNQRAIDQKEYKYLRELEKATESLGTLFDPTPGTVIGNIRSVNNPAVTVLGYFSGANLRSKRIFIDYTGLPEELQVPQPLNGCQIDTTCDISLPSDASANCTHLTNIGSTAVLISSIGPYGDPQAYNFVPLECGDCRVHGGALQKPDFW